MSHAVSSKQAAAYLIDPMNAPEPSAETGPGTHFGSTFAPAKSESSPRTSLSSNNPFRDDTNTNRPSSSGKNGATSTTRPVGSSTPPERFPNYREEAFASHKEHRRNLSGSAGPSPPAYNGIPPDNAGPSRRRGSSLKERYPGDNSHKPLDIIRRDSRKADRAPHLKKRSIPGADMIDRLDPALGGKAYHHEGPYDATLMARNMTAKHSPVAALQTTNEEALKATPREHIRDAVERHQPLDGVAIVPPGVPDQFGRTYNYEEGPDITREGLNGEPGYKRWSDKEYDPEDLKGESEPSFSLDRALRAHKIDDNGIEMENRAGLMKDYHDAERNGTLDTRDPVKIAGNDAEYAKMQYANDNDLHSSHKRSGSIKDTLKKRIGSIRRKNNNNDD